MLLPAPSVERAFHRRFRMVEPSHVWRGRVVTSLFAIVLSSASGLYIVLRPLHATGLTEAIAVSVFVVAGVVTCLGMRDLHRRWTSEREGRSSAERALKRAGELESLARALAKAPGPAEVT